MAIHFVSEQYAKLHSLSWQSKFIYNKTISLYIVWHWLHPEIDQHVELS